MTISNAIEFKDVTFTYPESKAPVLKKINFKVKKGSWTALIGHNGSGKSTISKLINGLLLPDKDSGSVITVSGMNLNSKNVWDIREKVGIVFQNPDNQFVGATVEDDVAFGLENKGIPLEEMQSRVKEALQLVGMSDFADREPSRLSGGQKQRVAIAGAIAMRPNIIILDEATSMLDPEGRLELIQTIKEIRDQYNMTVISITHDLDEVALSDRVLVMKRGKVESSSTPRELFARGEELLTLGLDIPFSANLISTLKNKGFEFTENYLTEKELEDQLWELLLKA